MNNTNPTKTGDKLMCSGRVEMVKTNACDKNGAVLYTM